MVATAGARRHLVRAEYLFALAVLAILLLMSAPSFRNINAPGAHVAQRALLARIDAVRQRARAEGRLYSIVFNPPTGTMSVIRWTPQPGRRQQRADMQPALNTSLPGQAVVEMTTLYNDVLLINRTGFPLSQGRIYLKSADGSHDSVDIGP